MATYNAASSTNNSNTVVFSHSTAIDRHTVWKVSGLARGALIPHTKGAQALLRNLGIGVTRSTPFTNKTS